VRVRWVPQALERLEAEGDYRAQDSPTAASITISRVFDAVDDLARHPLKGRPGRVAGTRELVVPRTSYIVVYRVRDQVVEVLSVQHAAQRRPEHFN